MSIDDRLPHFAERTIFTWTFAALVFHLQWQHALRAICDRNIWPIFRDILTGVAWNVRAVYVVSHNTLVQLTFLVLKLTGLESPHHTTNIEKNNTS